jgi:hypothetical protein
MPSARNGAIASPPQTHRRQTKFESTVPACRPERKDASRPQRSRQTNEACGAVQRAVLTLHHPLRSVVHIQHDRVPDGTSADEPGHVDDSKPDARIVNRAGGEVANLMTVPSSNGRQELGDDNPRVSRHPIEQGPKGKAHAQPTDENPGLVNAAEQRAGQAAEHALGAGVVVRHEHVVA